jgi:negative regulator of sigma E activity
MPWQYTDELLSAYLDGELSPAEQAQVESHLAGDPEARQLLDELRILASDVRSLPRHKAGEGFSERVVRAALAAQPASDANVVTSASAGRSTAAGGRRRVPAMLAGALAVAAAVALAVFVANRPGPGGGTLVHVPVTGDPPITGAVDPAILEKALASLRQAIPQEGEGLVLRLKIGGGPLSREALDAAFAAAGLGTRKAEDDTTGAHRFASDYQQKLAEKIAGQPAEATLAAADAVFVTAPLGALEKALAALATQPQAAIEISPLLSGKVVLEEGAQGEDAGTGSQKPKHFTQRLAADQLRLAKDAAPLAEITTAAATSLDPAKPIRVLILVEQVGQ